MRYRPTFYDRRTKHRFVNAERASSEEELTSDSFIADDEDDDGDEDSSDDEGDDPRNRDRRGRRRRETSLERFEREEREKRQREEIAAGRAPDEGGRRGAKARDCQPDEWERDAGRRPRRPLNLSGCRIAILLGAIGPLRRQKGEDARAKREEEEDWRNAKCGQRHERVDAFEDRSDQRDLAGGGDWVFCYLRVIHCHVERWRANEWCCRDCRAWCESCGHEEGRRAESDEQNHCD